jgi:uncharacterized protein (TIGR02646 family)
VIRVVRGAEPAKLTGVRAAKLGDLRRTAVARLPTGEEIDGYRVIAEEIWRAQHHKCCYCETGVLRDYNDVEHFRPKAEADRGPHCLARHGYWWLAFTWENVLFSCPGCNRGKAKGIQFPLDAGSIALDALIEEQPPGRELPLLVDPASECGLDHIEFKLVAGLWRPFGRTPRGDKTIEVCRLAREDLVERYTVHVDKAVLPEVKDVRVAMTSGDRRAVHRALWRAQQRLLLPHAAYVGLSYDAIVHLVPNQDLAPFALQWLRPE